MQVYVTHFSLTSRHRLQDLQLQELSSPAESVEIT